MAAEIFHRKGYAATTLQDIAEAVGLLKGSLYYYIDTKEDLLYRISRTIHEGARANIHAVRALQGSPEDRLRTLLELHVKAFGERLSWIRVFYTEYGALGPERRREIMADRCEYEQFMLELIAEGQRSGAFCPELDRVIATNALLTMVNSIYLWFRPGRDYTIESVASTCADLAMGGLYCGIGHRHRADGGPSQRRRRAR